MSDRETQWRVAVRKDGGGVIMDRVVVEAYVNELLEENVRLKAHAAAADAENEQVREENERQRADIEHKEGLLGRYEPAFDELQARIDAALAEVGDECPNDGEEYERKHGWCLECRVREALRGKP